MTLEMFVTTYEYWALLAGVALEGETVVIIAGLLAHSGYLSLPVVILISFGGAFAADQAWFQVGKRKGPALLATRPRWEARVDRVRRFLVRYQVIAILCYRFLYGTRTITPVVIGMSGFDTRRFVMLNLCSTLIWSVVVATAGYYFGHALELLLKDLERFELAIIVILFLGAGAFWVYRYLVKRQR